MSAIRRGDVYFIEQDGGPTYKGIQNWGRPGVIVSNNTGNRHAPLVTVVPLTTQVKKDLPTHVPIISTPKECKALCEQVTRVPKALLGDYIVTLTEDELSGLDAALDVALGIRREEYDYAAGRC